MISILTAQALLATSILGTGLMSIFSILGMFISTLAVLDFAPMRSLRNLLLWQGEPDKRYLFLLILALLCPLSGGPMTYVVAYEFVRVSWLNGYRRASTIYAIAFIFIQAIGLTLLSGFSMIGIQFLSQLELGISQLELGIPVAAVYVIYFLLYHLDLFIFGIVTNWNFNLREVIANKGDDDRRYLILLLIVRMLLWDIDSGILLIFMLFALWRAMYKSGLNWSLAANIILNISAWFGTIFLVGMGMSTSMKALGEGLRKAMGSEMLAKELEQQAKSIELGSEQAEQSESKPEKTGEPPAPKHEDKPAEGETAKKV